MSRARRSRPAVQFLVGELLMPRPPDPPAATLQSCLAWLSSSEDGWLRGQLVWREPRGVTQNCRAKRDGRKTMKNAVQSEVELNANHLIYYASRRLPGERMLFMFLS